MGCSLLFWVCFVGGMVVNFVFEFCCGELPASALVNSVVGLRFVGVI